MKKLLYILLFFTFQLSFLTLTSCTEKEEIGEYDNWQKRNAAFVDSIANVCRKNADGKWERICAFNLNDSVEALSQNNMHYIYVHKLEEGSGKYQPLYNDSVRVHYLGRLISSLSYSEGKIFDKSYSTYILNELTDVPSLIGVSSVVCGFSTALMHMKEGDNWRVYIPSYLGYGTKDSGSSNIPAYSTLIFDINLARVYKYKVDTDTSWH